MFIGVDEVGYGSIAGPLFICALKFFEEPDFELFDSKMISSQKRILLFEKIKKISNFKIGTASVKEIVKHGLAVAYKIALNRALEGMVGEIFIDGKANRGLNCTCVINGDKIIPSISAASIVAKVLRDKFMQKQAKFYPNYFFDKHKGYATKLHLDSIKKYGACKLHRINYQLFKEL